MISREEVQHIAKLARLGLTEKEVKKYQKELSSILDYVGKLKKIDTELSALSPESHPSEFENITREDRERVKGKAQGAKLLKLAPETKNGHLKVKSIIK
jgi:aspartyl/glutamyl-tRNA(Asn/Gln) amidotransferase C subunit